MLEMMIRMMALDEVQELAIMELAIKYPPLTDDQETDLIASVELNGIREPLVLFRDEESVDDQLLDGRNRLAAAIEVGLEEIPVRYFIGTIEEAEDLIIDLNEKRRHLLPVQRAYIADQHREIIARRSERRRLANLKQGVEVPECPLEVLSGEDQETGRTSVILAKKHNSGKNSIETVQKIRRVSEERMMDPDMEDGVIMTPRAMKATAVLNKMKDGKITVVDAVKNVFGEPGQEITPGDPLAKYRSQLNNAVTKFQEAARVLLDSDQLVEWENVRLKEFELHKEFGYIKPVEGLMDPDESRERFHTMEHTASTHGEKRSESPKISVLMTKPCGCDFSDMMFCEQCRK